MAVVGCFVGSAEVTDFDQAQKKECGSQASESDPHESRGNDAQWQKIDKKARAETRHDGFHWLAPREIIGALHDGLDRGRLGFGSLGHFNNRIAARCVAACIECTPLFIFSAAISAD